MHKKTLTLGLVGDFCLSCAHENSANYIDDALSFSKALNDKVDLSIANHEFCITPPDITEYRDMGLPAAYAENISKAGFDVFCLANNHIGDYGNETLLYTKKFLEDRNHRTVGVGNNLNEATAPLYIEKNGFKIAIINFCDATQYSASDSNPGLAPLNKNLLLKSVTDARLKSDIIIVILHTDLEFTNYPAPWRVSLSREIAENGADMIIQHHPHTLQGIEHYKNSLIAYSLGNFIFPAHGSDYMANKEGHVEESIYLTVLVDEDETGKKNISYDYTPVIINNDNITILPSAKKEQEIRQKMEKYSAALNDVSFLEKHHFDKCKTEMSNFLYDLYYRVAKKKFKEAANHIKVHFRTKAHTGWMKGFFTFGKF